MFNRGNMRTIFCILLPAILFPAPAFSGELGQKLFKKYIEFSNNRKVSRGADVSEKLCADRNAYVGLDSEDKEDLLAYWYFQGESSPPCGMLAILDDADGNLRQKAGFILSRKCNWEDEDAILELAKRRQDLNWHLVYAAGECKKQKAVPMLLEQAKDTNPNRAGTAVEALGKIGDPAALPVLKEAVKSGNVGLKGKAALALAQVGERELSRQAAKELLNMPDAKGEERLGLMHAQYAASHVFEYAGDEGDLPFIKEVRSREMGTETSIATARAVINIMDKAGLQFKDWNASPENKIIGITSLRGGADCWLGKEREFILAVKPLEKVIGLPYTTIFRAYANDADVRVATRFIAEAKYNMIRKDAEKILSEVLVSSKEDYILNLAKDRLRQVGECPSSK